TEKEWSFADEIYLAIKSKIEHNSILIKHIKDLNVYRGLTTGYNPAFILNKKQKDELINQDKKNKDIIKPLLQGRNIKKWVYNSGEEYLLFVPWHFPLHTNPKITGNSQIAENEFSEKYPLIF